MKKEIVTLKIDLSLIDVGKKYDISQIANSPDYQLALNGIEVESVSPSEITLEERLGGMGKAVHDQEVYLKGQPDLKYADDPKNMLWWGVGFLVGSKLTTSLRTVVSGISPEKTSLAGTNGLICSTASGDFGPLIRANNIDSVQMIGKSEKKVYVVIDDGVLSFEAADGLIGKSTSEKIYSLAEKYDGAAFAVIGQAAENRVRYAGIAFSTSNMLKQKSGHMRFAGRGGLGRVMAEKGVYAVVMKSSSPPLVQTGDVSGLNNEIGTGDATRKYRTLSQGTFFGNLESMEGIGANVHMNATKGRDHRTPNLFFENVSKEYNVKKRACQACRIGCWREISTKGEDSAILGKIDFEPGELSGPFLGIYDIEQVMKIIRMADEYGMDAISLNAGIGYILEKEGRFGDFTYVAELIKLAAEGKHPLKEGVLRLSNYDREIACQIKGLGLPAYPAEDNPGYGFTLRDHMAEATYNSAWSGIKNTLWAWKEFVINGMQIITADILGPCKFAKVSNESSARLYNNVFDELPPISADDLKNSTKKVYMQARGIDNMLGFTKEDDALPMRAHQDNNLGAPHFNTIEFFTALKEMVYAEFDKII